MSLEQAFIHDVKYSGKDSKLKLEELAKEI